MIVYTDRFKKNFIKRIPERSALARKFKDRLEMFERNRKNPVLRDHALVGKMRTYRAFSVGGDLRVIYIDEGERIRLIDIGSHNQVYS